jgi:hypothetical protein
MVLKTGSQSEPAKVFDYAVVLAFKANYINNMFGNIQTQFTVCVGLIYFMLKPSVCAKQLRAASSFCRIYAR